MAFPGGIENKIVNGESISLSRALTSDEKASLQSELTNNPASRPYRAEGGALAGVAELLDALNGSYAVNSLPQTRVARTTCTRDEFTKFMISVQYAATVAGGTMDAKYALIEARLMPYIQAQDTILLTSGILTAEIAQMESDGLVSADDVATFSTEPDPAWQPQAVHPARCNAIFSEPLTLEESDLEGLS